MKFPSNKKYSSRHLSTINDFIDKNFTDHPGNTSEDFWVPFNRKEALEYLDEFFEVKFELFGPYEDAIYDNHSFLFHSAISPLTKYWLTNPNGSC